MRKRDAIFLNYFLEELRKGDLEGAKLSAGRRMGWLSGNPFRRTLKPMRDKLVLRKVNNILGRAEITEAIRSVFEVAADFSPVEAARLMARHIRGEIVVEKTHVTRDGEVIRYEAKLEPSLDALKTYNALALPKPPKQVQVDTRMLVAHQAVNAPPPGMRARVLPSEKPKELAG